ncbi:hypothetical protein [Propioniciclava soli]|uniref:hypothetical protein n=1 Tax=Propioniciclava soli TaxID=2775081 RepID=UPI001E6312A0|nr:hypothetical protein [Propioniciclava soli]
MVKPMTVAGAVVCWGVLLVGCTPAGGSTPSPEPTPEPTFQCTPEAGGEAYACDEAEHERMVARDEQYAEAERVYRRAMETANDLLIAKEAMSDGLRDLTVGAAQEDLEKTLLEASRSDVAYSGEMEIEWVRPTNIADRGSDLALEICSSPGTQSFTANGETTAIASYVLEDVFFTKTDGGIKLSSIKGAEVEEC